MDWNAAWLSNMMVTPKEPTGVQVNSTATSTRRCLVVAKMMWPKQRMWYARLHRCSVLAMSTMSIHRASCRLKTFSVANRVRRSSIGMSFRKEYVISARASRISSCDCKSTASLERDAAKENVQRTSWSSCCGVNVALQRITSSNRLSWVCSSNGAMPAQQVVSRGNDVASMNTETFYTQSVCRLTQNTTTTTITTDVPQCWRTL